MNFREGGVEKGQQSSPNHATVVYNIFQSSSFLSHSSRNFLRKPLEFSKREDQWPYLLSYYLVFCSQFLKLPQSYKNEMGVLLFITSLFQWQVYVNEVTFGNPLRMRARLPGEPTLIWRLEFSVTAPDGGGAGGVGGPVVGWIPPIASNLINHAYVTEPP